MVCNSVCFLLILFNHAVYTDDFFAIWEVQDIRLVLAVMIRILLPEQHDLSIILFDFNVANYSVVPDQDLNDTLAHLEVDFVASALLRTYKVLEIVLVVISQDCIFARVECVKL